MKMKCRNNSNKRSNRCSEWKRLRRGQIQNNNINNKHNNDNNEVAPQPKKNTNLSPSSDLIRIAHSSIVAKLSIPSKDDSNLSKLRAKVHHFNAKQRGVGSQNYHLPWLKRQSIQISTMHNHFGRVHLMWMWNVKCLNQSMHTKSWSDKWKWDTVQAIYLSILTMFNLILIPFTNLFMMMKDDEYDRQRFPRVANQM